MNYLADHQTFTSKYELNEAVNEHITSNNRELNETDRDVLLAISRYAVKFPGAAHLKADTLASIVGKSTITVRRVINKLVRLQIIEKRPFIRTVKKGFGANLLLILPFNDKSVVITRSEAEKPVPATDEAAKTKKEPCSFINKKELVNNTYSKTVPVYRQFINLLTSKLGNSKLAGRLYGVLLAKKKVDNTMGILALETALNAQEEGLIRKDVVSYYSGVLDRMIQSRGPVREEMLPKWFANPEAETLPLVDTDDDFLAEAARLKAELIARKTKGVIV